MFLKFIMGVEPIENFDKYVEQIKALGIGKYLSIQQTALDRFNRR
jgi:putative aldouronate transport system substrate-binding protein